MLFAVFIFVFAVNSIAAKKALLVGISDYRDLPPTHSRGIADLKGAVNDVKIVRNALISFYGFQASDIKTLTDHQATYQNIESQITQWLINGSFSGDTVVFYFAGHGSQVPDKSADEDDGYDEVLCPYDLIPDGGLNIILDDDIGKWMRQMKGRNVVFIIDSCYSGGAVRGYGAASRRIQEPNPAWRTRFIEITNYRPPPRATQRSGGVDDTPDPVVYLSASRENEPAIEVRMPGGFYGGFTYGLVEAMQRLRSTTYNQLFDHADKIVKDRLKLIQKPQILANQTSKGKIAFGASNIWKHPPAKAIISESQTSEVTKVKILLEPLSGTGRLEMKRLAQLLGDLNFVEFVNQSEFFDCLVRGDKIYGKYLVRLLNNIGDVEKLDPASSIEDVARLIAKRLDYIHAVKSLDRIRQSIPPFNLRAWVNDDSQRDFMVGKKVVFNVESNRDCYVLLINVDSQGAYHILLPNRLQVENYVQAGRSIQLPNSRLRRQGVILDLSLPGGEEYLKCIATTKPLNFDILDFEGTKGIFISLTHQKRSLFRKEIIKALKDEALVWSEDTVVIRTYQ
jgi:hypothetical protein